MVTLPKVAGRLCPRHGAVITVSTNERAAVCAAVADHCTTAVLRAWAMTLNEDSGADVAGSIPAIGSTNQTDEGGDAQNALEPQRSRSGDMAPSVGLNGRGRTTIPELSNGRTALFESANAGSTPASGVSRNGHLPARRAPTNDHLLRVPPHDLIAEQSVLGAILLVNDVIEEAARIIHAADFYREAHRMIFAAMQKLWRDKVAIDPVTVRAELERQKAVAAIGGLDYLSELASVVPTEKHTTHYAQIVKAKAVSREIATKATALAALAYDGVSAEALIGEAGRLLTPIVSENRADEAISWESFDLAVSANEEYLKRTPVIDKLCYSSAVSLITGGKHAGKSTLARWMAICVAKGWPVLGREVRQGPVFYIASEDETMAARQELIHLGWTPRDPLRFFAAQNVEDPDRFLLRLTDEIRAHGVVFVVLDMLFDFVRIADEMSYAGTRAALGKIQNVASASGAHLLPIHHAPKNAMIGDAAVAALGSQGLAARVSPIILVRRFGPGVHSISSTSVRDPRGEALIESRLVKNPDGSVTLGGAWKNYMLAEVYADRVLAFLKEDPEAEVTKLDIAEALDIAPAVARGCLAMLYKQGVIARRGDGKRGKPFRYAALTTELPEGRSATNHAERTPVDLNERGRFGYKD